MNSIPYLHYSRRSLKDVYELDYKRLIKYYKNDLDKWLDDWKTYITSKYIDNPITETVKPMKEYEQTTLFDIA